MDRGEPAGRLARLAYDQMMRIGLRVADGAVQVFGGHGYIRDYLPELHLRNLAGLAELRNPRADLAGARPSRTLRLGGRSDRRDQEHRAMAIDFELSPAPRFPSKHYNGIAREQMRPISRKYDLEEHTLPTEWVDFWWNDGPQGPAGQGRLRERRLRDGLPPGGGALLGRRRALPAHADAGPRWLRRGAAGTKEQRSSS